MLPVQHAKCCLLHLFVLPPSVSVFVLIFKEVLTLCIFVGQFYWHLNMPSISTCWSPCFWHMNVREGTFAVAFYTTVSFSVWVTREPFVIHIFFVQFFPIVIIAYTAYVMRGGDSAQFYLPYFEADVKDSKKFKPSHKKNGNSNHVFFFEFFSNAVCWGHSYSILLDVHHLLLHVGARRQKRVQRSFLSLDDLHDTCGFISSCLWLVDHHWLLHCKFYFLMSEFKSDC